MKKPLQVAAKPRVRWNLTGAVAVKLLPIGPPASDRQRRPDDPVLPPTAKTMGSVEKPRSQTQRALLAAGWLGIVAGLLEATQHWAFRYDPYVLTERGVVFENAWSTTSWTLPAHASMLTGRPAYEHGTEHGSRFDTPHPVLPEFLQAHGYLTGAFIANDVWLTPELGFDRGFLTFKVYTPFSLAARTAMGRKIDHFLTETLRLRTPVRKSAPKVTREFLDWVDRNTDRPFFALLNYFDVHDPYLPPHPYKGMFDGDSTGDSYVTKPKLQRLNNDYDSLIAYLDVETGTEELFDWVRDPRELHNRAGEPETAGMLDGFRSQMRALFTDLPVPSSSASVADSATAEGE